MRLSNSNLNLKHIARLSYANYFITFTNAYYSSAILFCIHINIIIYIYYREYFVPFTFSFYKELKTLSGGYRMLQHLFQITEV